MLISGFKKKINLQIHEEFIQSNRLPGGSDVIEKRIFLVGCPRSGTTLFQRILASHPQIRSFPETHFFTYYCGRALKRLPQFYRNYEPRRLKEFKELLKYRCRLGSPQGGEAAVKNFLLEPLELNELKTKLIIDSYLWSKGISQFVKILDDLALSSGCTLWLEKVQNICSTLRQSIDMSERRK
ncbi:MAG: sulfotransferase [Verrucomicrobiae bacterium]|nr:sulfotransferase [Verrucomicrobiae bacterium]